jgi:uncharacterized repeat protein (TIGR01451 family)
VVQTTQRGSRSQTNSRQASPGYPTTQEATTTQGTGIWSVGDLANADTATLRITATVDTGTAGTTITNTSQVTASDQNDPDQDNNTDTATIRVAAADLELAKTVDTMRPHEGDDVVYTVVVINRGPDDTSGVEVTDQLPAGVTWVSDDSGGAYDPGTGIWAVGGLSTGIFEVLNITASVDEGTVSDTIVNTASVTASSQADPDLGNNTAAASITVAGADLGIGKTVNDPHPQVGDTVFYSVQVTNGGPDLTTNITVTDQLPGGVTWVEDDSGGTYDPTTGLWDVPSLAIGATTTLQITVTIDDGTAGTTITNTATITASDQNDANPGNDTDTADVIVVGADLRILKAVDDHTPSEGTASPTRSSSSTPDRIMPPVSRSQTTSHLESHGSQMTREAPTTPAQVSGPFHH